MGVQKEFKALLQAGIEKAGGKGALAKALGIRNQTVTAWVYGASPRLENIECLAKYVENGVKKKIGTKNK